MVYTMPGEFLTTWSIHFPLHRMNFKPAFLTGVLKRYRMMALDLQPDTSQFFLFINVRQRHFS